MTLGRQGFLFVAGAPLSSLGCHAGRAPILVRWRFQNRVEALSLGLVLLSPFWGMASAVLRSWASCAKINWLDAIWILLPSE